MNDQTVLFVFTIVVTILAAMLMALYFWLKDWAGRRKHQRIMEYMKIDHQYTMDEIKADRTTEGEDWKNA